ncbi:MAG: M20 family metallopeptidase [Anaerolineae bacterium]|jgi:glutamate carboxypeptidase
MEHEINREILTFLRRHQGQMADQLTLLIELESPTDHKPSLDRLSTYLAAELLALGARVETLPQAEAGDHVRARWGEGQGGALMLCHMDTVWDVGTVAERPVRIEEGRLYGPGAHDMKGGIVITLWAVRALRELGLLPAGAVTLLLTSDEETGSLTSRSIIEAEALKHRLVFVMEPPVPPEGSYKTARKGVGDYRVEVTGRAAHSGADHARGINALQELAHQVQAIQGFTDYERGTTFNVGRAGGGTRRNVVPAEAWAEIDVRIVHVAEAERVEAQMQSLRPHLPGAEVKVTGGFERPPMERTAEIAALFGRAQDLARGMGLDLSEASTGGASDGNLTAALGVPTLDGMGVVGDGGHAIDEHALISSLPKRAAILAAMLRGV